MNIGEAAAQSGVSAKMIRHYETLGLVRPIRRANNYRAYTVQNVAVLRFIRHARELGFPLDAIRSLLALSERPDRSCEKAHALASSQLALVEDKLRRLESLRTELTRLADACRGGVAAECRILETLADHSHGHCVSPDHADADAVGASLG